MENGTKMGSGTKVASGRTMAYDVIGDIHGYVGKLKLLLKQMGYTQRGRRWIPPQGRQAVFVGDLIDRGPEQASVVEIVRAMIDAGDAHCVLGNHEFNAIGWVTPREGTADAWLREHSPKNRAQHGEFLKQVGEGSALHRELVNWFRTLPPSLELDGIRAVHAWWHTPHVELVSRRGQADGLSCDEFLHASFTADSLEWQAMEGLTKGLEMTLPVPHSFIDHAGVERNQVRTKWWKENARSYRDVAIVGDNQAHRVPDHPLPDDYPGGTSGETPVFVGHYWMTGTPRLESHRVACVDWSAAKDGPLVAYRWDGERHLDARHFVAAG